MRAALAALAIAAWLGPWLPGPGGETPAMMHHRKGGGGAMAMGPRFGRHGRGMHNPLPATPEAIAEGRALFQARCAACHGPRGRGDGPAAGALQPPPADLARVAGTRPDMYFFRVVSFGRNRMPAYRDALSERERWLLVHFIQALAR